MIIPRILVWLRTSRCVPLCCAGAAVILAVCAASGRLSAHGAATREISTTAVRPGVEIVTAPDLGNVVVGVPFTRQIVVRFGYKPHHFAFGQLAPADAGIAISESGTISGKIAQAGMQTFSVLVVDNSSPLTLPTAEKAFSITAVVQQTDGPVHFAESNQLNPDGTQQIALPVAVAHEPYSYTIQGNGGNPPYTYLLKKEANKNFLPDGLAFNFETNELQGTPIAPTPVTQSAQFNILISDSRGRTALGIFSLSIQPGTISSQLVATAGGLKLLFGKDDGRDNLALKLSINKTELGIAHIRQPSDLENLEFTMNFGGRGLPPAKKFNADGSKASSTEQSVTGIFNSSGSINLPPAHKVVGDIATQPVGEVSYSISLDPRTGILKTSYSNVNLIRALGANFNSFESDGMPAVPLNIKISLPAEQSPTGVSGAAIFDKSDVVGFLYKRRLDKGVGRAGANTQLAPAGLFLIDRVKGNIEPAPVTTSPKADLLFLRMSGFLRTPGGKPVVPASGDTVEIFIDSLCLGAFPASSLARSGNKLLFANDDASKGIRTLIIDNTKGTVVIETNGILPSALTPLGEEVLIAGEPLTVAVTLTFLGADPENPTFDGQSSVTLFRKGNQVRNK